MFVVVIPLAIFVLPALLKTLGCAFSPIELQDAGVPRASPEESKHLANEHDEHDEDDVRPSMPRRTPSNVLEEDSDLGDSWAVKADAGFAGSGNKEVGKKTGEGDGVGVLGLLYQFQKAQTEGRGPNI